MRRWSALGIVAATVVVRCLDPTEFLVVLTTDLDCSQLGPPGATLAKIVVSKGTLASLDGIPPSATVDVCDNSVSPHSLGDIILTPGGDPSGPVQLGVVAGVNGKSPDDCSSTAPDDCIFARRTLRYLPHTSLRLPIALDMACVGVPCPNGTCVEGMCRDATIVDPSKCQGDGCDQSTLLLPPRPDPPGGVMVRPVPVGVVTTLAGSSLKQGNADGTGAAASFDQPLGVALDGGNVYVADCNNSRIREVTSAGVVTTLAGSGNPAFLDGTGAGASFYCPTGITVDSGGAVYVADSGNNRIRKVTSAGVVTTLAGSGTATFADGAGTGASFQAPYGVTLAVDGSLYVADFSDDRIRRVTTGGVVSTLAGSPGAFADGTGPSATFFGPQGVAVDGAGNVYVGDSLNNRIRQVTSAGVVSTLAGSGNATFADGTGSAASFWTPSGIAVDDAGNVYVGDSVNNRIRQVTSAGVVSTLAGSGNAGSSDGTGTAAAFHSPTGLALDRRGNLYVADSMNNEIRAVTIPGSLAVSWTASNAAVTRYTATAIATAQPTRTCTASGLSCTIVGLTRNVTYGVTVTATNDGGTSAPSTPIVMATPN